MKLQFKEEIYTNFKKYFKKFTTSEKNISNLEKIVSFFYQCPEQEQNNKLDELDLRIYNIPCNREEVIRKFGKKYFLSVVEN